MIIMELPKERFVTLPIAEKGCEIYIENKEYGRVKVNKVFRSKRILHKGDKVTYIYTGSYWRLLETT